MIHKKNGLNDSDKIFVTIALWICAVSIFAILLTLPMLPDNIVIFEQKINGVSEDLSSKFNNLLLIFMIVIPAIIVLIAASMKKRNRLQNNFMSIVLFSIILSFVFSSLIIYGIIHQFSANHLVKTLNYHGLIAAVVGFIFSMTSCLLPTIVHVRNYDIDGNSFLAKALDTEIKYWNIGAYGYLVFSIVSCAFIPDLYCYIPIAAALIAHAVFLSVLAKRKK